MDTPNNYRHHEKVLRESLIGLPGKSVLDDNNVIDVNNLLIATN